MSNMPPNVATVTLLGVDYGQKMSGIALYTQKSIIPLEIISTDTLLQRLLALLDEKKAAGLVFGLPVNHRGAPNPVVAEIQAFARHFASFTRLFFVDEFQTSQNLTQHKKDRIDDLSAVRILQFFLQEQKKAPFQDIS